MCHNDYHNVWNYDDNATGTVVLELDQRSPQFYTQIPVNYSKNQNQVHV